MKEENARKLICPLMKELCLGYKCICWGYNDIEEEEFCKYFD